MKVSGYVYVVVKGNVGNFTFVNNSQNKPRIYFSLKSLKQNISQIRENERIIRFTLASTAIEKQDIDVFMED